MSGAKVYTIEEIRNIYNTEKPKYIALRNPSGSFEVMFNNPKMSSEEKFSEIQRALKKKTLPPGIYYFVAKNNFSKKAAEHSFPLGIGNFNPADIITTISSSSEDKIPSVWSPQEAVKYLSEINRLTLELENAKATIEELEKTIEELENEAEEIEKLEESTPAPVSWIEKLIEIGSPLLSKHFEQRDKELQLLAEKLKADQEKNRRRNPDDPDYLEHLQKIILSGATEEIQSEMMFLKNSYPGFYEEICKAYQINPA